jgi:hypothetical protein
MPLRSVALYSLNIRHPQRKVGERAIFLYDITSKLLC